jgi:hypothetical protein
MNAPGGIWIWQLAKIDPNYIARMRAIGVGRVYLKVMDGRSTRMFWEHQCTSAIVSSIKQAGIEVFGWGYHYAVDQPANEVAAVGSAMSCGLDGYVVDIEMEAEAAGAGPRVALLLDGIRPLVPAGRLGYTSFGAPQYHLGIPWRILNTKTDFAMPQIYFESFGFGSSNEAEVMACIQANRALPGIKEILPIWSSESGARTPASAAELQGYLDRFPGSSMWRVPHVGEAGEAWNLRYDSEQRPLDDIGEAVRGIGYIVRPGATGPDVAAIRALLATLGYPSSGPADVFNDSLEAAVRQFQTIAGIGVDGKVGPETIAALTGRTPAPLPELGLRERLALIAQEQGDLRLRWINATSEAEKYLEPLRAEMHRRGHIGTAPVLYDWCGAFVLWCCRQAGYTLPDVPDVPPNYYATYALVDAWVDWAKAKGYWRADRTDAARGDIVIFDWPNDARRLNHVGIVSSFTPGSASFRSSEGNSGNQTINQTRSVSTVVGYVRLPAGGL